MENTMDYSALESPSLILRIGVGKLVGLLIGLAGVTTLLTSATDVGWMLMIGLVFWYSSLGAIVGVFGVFDKHPLFGFRFPWWLRSSLLGAWFNFVLILLAYEQISSTLNSMSHFHPVLFTSPFWFVLEGAIIGFLIGGICTWFGGEGPETVQKK